MPYPDVKIQTWSIDIFYGNEIFAQYAKNLIDFSFVQLCRAVSLLQMKTVAALPLLQFSWKMNVVFLRWSSIRRNKSIRKDYVPYVLVERLSKECCNHFKCLYHHYTYIFIYTQIYNKHVCFIPWDFFCIYAQNSRFLHKFELPLFRSPFTCHAAYSNFRNFSLFGKRWFFHCNTLFCTYIFFWDMFHWYIVEDKEFLQKPSKRKKFCKDDVKPCQHCVPSPMLKIIVPPDSSGSTVPQIAGYDFSWSRVTHHQTEMAFSSCSSMNKIKVFQKQVHDTKKVRIVQPGLFCDGIPLWRAGSHSGLTFVGGLGNHSQMMFRFMWLGWACSSCTHSLPQRKVESSFVGFCCMTPFAATEKRSSSFYWVQKNFGHWVGVLSRHPWCWITKYVLEHPQWHESCDLASVVRFTNSSPSLDLKLETILKGCSYDICSSHCSRHLCQDLAPAGHSWWTWTEPVVGWEKGHVNVAVIEFLIVRLFFCVEEDMEKL